MRKIGLALLWIALAASLTMMFIVIGQNNALTKKNSSAAKKNQSIQALYEDAKGKLKDAVSGMNQLTQQNTALTQEKTALEEKLTETDAALQAANEALAEARHTWEQQAQTLTAEKDATNIRLAQALAVLMPEQAEPAPNSTGTECLIPFMESDGGDEGDFALSLEIGEENDGEIEAPESEDECLDSQQETQ